MKRSKTHVDNLGIQALANVYPNELGRIMFLSTNTGKVVLHYFMDSDDPSVKLIRRGKYHFARRCESSSRCICTCKRGN